MKSVTCYQVYRPKAAPRFKETGLTGKVNGAMWKVSVRVIHKVSIVYDQATAKI